MELTVLIEIPKGSKNKYEVDEKTGEIILDRALHSPVYYPFEYGHIRKTLGEDGDPLDVVLFSTFPTFPGCLVNAEVIGYLEMEDESGIDHKIIAVPTAKIDPRWSHIREVKDLPEHYLKETKEFFEIMKRLEPNKWVKVQEFKSKKDAEKLIVEAQKRFKSA